MSWYAARLLYESVVSDSKTVAPLCEESTILIEAQDEEDARRKANRLGKQRGHSYRNPYGEKVAWKFVNVIELQDLCEDRIENGTEVFSRLFRKGAKGE